MNIQKEIQTIQETSSFMISELLGCSIDQANKLKRGYSGLSNQQAHKLKNELGLSPYVFNEIYTSYQEKKGMK